MRKFLSDIRFLFAREDLWRFTVLLAGLVVNSFLELLSLASVPVFIALLLAGGRADGSRGVDALVRLAHACSADGPSRILLFGGLLVLLANFVRMMWMRGCIALQARMLNHRKVALASRLLESYLRAPADFHAQRNTSDQINRVVVECDHVLQHVVAPLLDFSQNCVVILCICALLLCWMPGMTVVAVGALGLFGGGYLAYHQRRMRQLGEQEQQARSQAMKVANEALAGRVEATVLGKRHFFLERFHRVMELVAEAQRANDVQIRIIWPYLEFVSLGVILVVTLVSLQLHQGDLGMVAPRIALLGMALVRLRTNAINLMHSWNLLRYHQVSLRVVCEDLRQLRQTVAQELTLEQEDSLPPWELSKELSLRNVSFRYPGAGADALHNLSLTIARGESIGIVGPTGGGKSTLLKILLGILQPTAGEMLVDGKTLDTAAQRAAWQHGAGLVPQQLFLLDDTLAANIALGVPKAQLNSAELQSVVKVAQLPEVIDAQKDGLETLVGEQGLRLSGGQRQRIAIARALFRQPKVLFWDEATSALDNETEARLSNALERLAQDRTMVLVTHRLATVRHCDRILVIDHGALVASGSYEELLATSPVFRELAQDPLR